MNNYDVVEIAPCIKGEQLIKFEINSSVDEILSFIELIEDEMKVSKPSFAKLRDNCFALICRLPLPTHTLNASFLLRGRENKNGEIFSSASQISYNPFPERIFEGRFNLKQEAVFYATVPTCSHGSSGQLTAICESCKDLMDENIYFSTKYFTVGKWNIITPIKVVALTFNEEVEKKSFHAKNINKPFLDFLLLACSSEDYNKCFSFFSLISKYAAQKYDDAESYLLTTAYFHALRKYYGSNVAVLYPSYMTDKKGLNLVFSKEFIDNQNIKLIESVMYKTVRKPNNFKSYNIFPCTSVVPVDENGKFEFKNIW